MKKTRFTERQILQILRELEGGVSVVDLSRQHGISTATMYNWRTKYAGMTESNLKRLKKLEEENFQLKQMYAELSLDNAILKDVVSKKS